METRKQVTITKEYCNLCHQWTQLTIQECQGGTENLYCSNLACKGFIRNTVVAFYNKEEVTQMESWVS